MATRRYEKSFGNLVLRQPRKASGGGRKNKKIKELTEYKDRCEIALVEELKKASPKQKTFILDDICVTVTDNKGY